MSSTHVKLDAAAELLKASRLMSTQLQQHKEQVADKIHGLITTVNKIPHLIHKDTTKQLQRRCVKVAASAKELQAREPSVLRTKQLLGQIPSELSAYDQILDELLLRCGEIQRSTQVLSSSSNASRDS
eukprot:jgi/Chrzof1/1549/Cz10g12030.t1